MKYGGRGFKEKYECRSEDKDSGQNAKIAEFLWAVDCHVLLIPDSLPKFTA